MSRPVVVFVGDSITDCDRRTDPSGLGDGYVRQLALAPELRGFDVRNRGIAGDRAVDLERRWAEDVLAAEPALVSILVGVNEVWRRFDSGDPTSPEAFAGVYRRLLEPLATNRLVLVEPFLLPVNEEQASWLEDLDGKRRVVRTLARGVGATFVPAHDSLTALGDPHGLAPDGVHPSAAGHRELAALWLREAGSVLAAIPR
mgnify:CR=1 FL=1